MNKKPPIFDRFSTRLKNTFLEAEEIAEKSGNKEVDTTHLLYGIMKQHGGIAKEILQTNRLTMPKLRELAGIPVSRAKDSKKLQLGNFNIDKLSVESKKAIEMAVTIAYKYKHKFVATEHLLFGIVNTKDSKALRILAKINVNLNNLNKQIEAVFKSTSKFPSLTNIFKLINQIQDEDLGGMMQDQMPGQPPEGMGMQMPPDIMHQGGTDAMSDAGSGIEAGAGKKSILTQFAKELTNKKNQGKIDPVIGREKEIKRVINVLGRRNKNNPMLIGEAGVGKTAIVEGLAKKIYENDIPEYLSGKKIFTIDLALLVAGTIYRGEFEARLKQLIEEVSKNPNAILFIDEIHTIIGAGTAGGGTMDAANIIKPALARGEFQVIGATTFDEYRKNIEKDPALERRFQPILVEESSINETKEILFGLKRSYELFHKIEITEEAIEAAVKFSERYIQDRCLPDKAIDLIDEAASKIKVQKPISKDYKEVKDLQDKLVKIVKDKQNAVVRQDFANAYSIREAEREISEKINTLQNKQKKEKGEMNGKITKVDIAKLITETTKIPVTDLTGEDSRELIDLEKKLSAKVVGQDEVIKEISNAIRRSRAGISDPKRPSGSFIFLGPTGVGKTELAKVLAEIVFGSSNALIKIDMSEFMEKFNVSRLVGAAAGYVGYEEGGKLTEQVRRKPYSVVLFDEIEKAHPDVFNLLLQILEDGILTDNKGRKINFKHTIIIMTSNIGTKEFTNSAVIGFEKGKKGQELLKEDYNRLKADVLKNLERELRPELLNRIDKILVFKPLKINDIKKIIDLQIEGLQKRLDEKKIKVELPPKVKDFIARKGYDPKKGARPIRRMIQDIIEDPLAQKILLGKSKEIKKFEFKIEKDKVKIS